MKRINLIDLEMVELIQGIKDAVIPELTAKLSDQFQPIKPNEYLTRSEVCSLLKINLSTLYRWCKDGTLSSMGIGNRVYFLRSHIEEVLMKNKLS